MANLSHFLIGAFIASLLVIMGFRADDDKYFPDFSCHQSYDFHARDIILKYRGNWKLCKDDGKRKKYFRGECDKVCQLAKFDVIIRGYSEISETNRRPTEDHSIIRWDEAAAFFGKVSGMAEQVHMSSSYERKGIEKTMEWVGDNMKNCSITHGNTTTVKISEACDKWEPILDCLEKAYGCYQGSQFG